MAESRPRSIHDAINELERFLVLRDNLTATEVQAIGPIIQWKIAALPSCSLANWHESEIETLEALTKLRIRLQALEFDAGPVTKMIQSCLRSMRDAASRAEPQVRTKRSFTSAFNYRRFPTTRPYIRGYGFPSLRTDLD